MRTMILAAAAVLATPLPAASAIAATVAVSEQGKHIRTTLHGAGGPVVVLIPGMSTPGAVWDETVASLQGDYRILVLEVRGFDGTVVPENGKKALIPGIVDELSADLRARGIPQAAIVGHSFGGLVALQFALLHPGQADRLLIVDALPFFGTVFDPSATVASTMPRAEAMRAQMLAGREAMRAAAKAGVTRDPGGGMAKGADNRIKIANWSLRADGGVVAQALYEDLMLDLRQDIARIEAPITVLYQAGDPEKARARYSADYAAQPKAKLVPVPDAAHFIMLDQPELFRAELKAFVSDD
jgi:pimeloyl-ACP methyl ester carboxylesterase